MTTPDAQARTLGDAIDNQLRQREAAKTTAREIERDRERKRQGEAGEELE